jgi:hypothetical protein
MVSQSGGVQGTWRMWRTASRASNVQGRARVTTTSVQEAGSGGGGREELPQPSSRGSLHHP